MAQLITVVLFVFSQRAPNTYDETSGSGRRDRRAGRQSRSPSERRGEGKIRIRKKRTDEKDGSRDHRAQNPSKVVSKGWTNRLLFRFKTKLIRRKLSFPLRSIQC